MRRDGSPLTATAEESPMPLQTPRAAVAAGSPTTEGGSLDSPLKQTGLEPSVPPSRVRTNLLSGRRSWLALWGPRLSRCTGLRRARSYLKSAYLELDRSSRLRYRSGPRQCRTDHVFR